MWNFRKQPKPPKPILPGGVEYKSFRHLQIITILALGLAAGVIGRTLWFVYSHIYQTIDKAQVLSILQNDPQIKPINFNLYEKTQANWAKKTAPASTSVRRDPFILESATTTTLPGM